MGVPDLRPFLEEDRLWLFSWIIRVIDPETPTRSHPENNSVLRFPSGHAGQVKVGSHKRQE